MSAMQRQFGLRFARVVCAHLVVFSVVIANAQHRPSGVPGINEAIQRLNTQVQQCQVKPTAVELLDGVSGKPLQPLVGGLTEAFFPVVNCDPSGPDALLAFVGLYSGRKVHAAPYGNLSNHPGELGGYDKPHSFKDPVGRALVARPWCC